MTGASELSAQDSATVTVETTTATDAASDVANSVDKLADAGGMTGRPNRRVLSGTVLAGIAGGVLATVVAGQTWAHARAGQPPLTLKVTASGSDLSGAVSALGLAGIAGALALLATAHLGRQLVGLLLTASGAGLTIAALTADSASNAAKVLSEKAGNKGVGSTVTGVSTSSWPYLAALAGLIVALTGIAALVRGRDWPGMSSRYEAPATREARVAATAREHAGTPKGLWDALDRGEDPTSSASPPTAPPTPGTEH